MAKKLYYKIGEACKKLDIQPYVLRYWEKEFPILSPHKSKSGQRVYSDRELGIIRRIKELLYDEGYTIAGAKKKLEIELAGDDVAETSGPPPKAATPTGAESPSKVDSSTAEELEKLKSGIVGAVSQARAILAVLESTPAKPG